MMHFQTLIFLLTLLFPWSLPANILGIFPLPVRSHYTVFETVLKALAEKGHNVDMVTPLVSKDAPPSYNQISTEGIIPNLANNLSMDIVETWHLYNMIDFITSFAGVDLCEAVFKSPVLENLKKTEKKYDLVVTEIFGTECMLGFGHVFQVPTVLMISSVIIPWANDRFGNPDNPAYIPTYFTSAGSRMTLYERIDNTLRLIVTKFLYFLWSTQNSNVVSRKFFGEDLPSLDELGRNSSLILVNSHLSISYSRPVVPNVIEVGGLHIREPKPLSQYFKEVLTTDLKGVIVFSMGSMVASESFPPDKLQGLFDAFAVLPYKILWKANRERFPKILTIPPNIHFENWLPQMDVICDPNVKLFVSHGGLLGLQEAVYCGVPRLGIPLFADQEKNNFAAEQMGLAVTVPYKHISKQTILEAAQKLLQDPSYKANCERVSHQFKDRPMSPLDTAVYWVEYVIRHKGAPHLRSAGADLPWYQFYLVDVIGILGFGVFVVIYAIVKVLKLIGRFLRGGSKQKRE